MTREVTARPVDTLESGEGHWVVLLPSTPPRAVEVMVAPVGSVPGEKWISLGYDRPTQTHLGGAGANAADALYAVIDAYDHLMAGRWPVVAHTADPRSRPEPVTIVPLACDPPPATGLVALPPRPTPTVRMTDVVAPLGAVVSPVGASPPPKTLPAASSKKGAAARKRGAGTPR